MFLEFFAVVLRNLNGFSEIKYSNKHTRRSMRMLILNSRLESDISNLGLFFTQCQRAAPT